MQAKRLLIENIKALLRGRKEDASTLASWLGHDKSWINKILNGHREMQLSAYDQVADFFGIATYQLFQPGISALTERRIRADRRTGKERRIGQAQRVMLGVAAEVHRHRRGKSEHVTVAASSPLMEALDRAAAEHARQIDAIISRFTELGNQTPAPRKRVASASPRRRTPRGPDSPQT